MTVPNEPQVGATPTHPSLALEVTPTLQEPGSEKTTGGATTEEDASTTVDVEAARRKESAIANKAAIESKHVSGLPLLTIFIGMLMSVFLVALDQTIVATALPRIASDFNALQQITFFASAYFVTQSGLILTYGQLLRVAPAKYIYLFAVTVFEIGSAICGSAPNSGVLIFGRAVAGCGAAGIFVSCLSILATITPLHRRPLFFGMFGGVFGFSSVAGPLIGGAFTDHVSWRWCFYINLPFGAITIASIIVFIKPEHSVVATNDPTPTWKRILKLDWIGTILCLGMIAALVLALQWGGVTKPWSDKGVVACLCVVGVLLPTWIAWEWYKGDKANMPLYLFKRRTQVGCCIEAFFVMLLLLQSVYYLPLYYQSSKQHSATRSGLDILSFMFSVVGGAGVSGAIIRKLGRPKPFLVIGPLLSSIGSGLVFWDLTKAPNASHLYGFQVPLGLGVGCALQNTIISIQAEHADNPVLVPQATSLVQFTQLTGGILGISIAGTIFGNHLSSSLAKYAPDLPPQVALAVRQSVQVVRNLPPDQQVNVLHAYTESLGYVFILGIVSGIMASLAGMLVRHFNLRKMGVTPGLPAGE